MKIDEKDFKRIIDNVDTKIVSKKHITDINKYIYWNSKSIEYIQGIEDSVDSESKAENFRQSLLCEFEKNKYQRIPKKDYLMLKLLLTGYNMSNRDKKLYMDKKGLRVSK